ncbi:MAG: thymidine phosphorylase [Vulcanimicrobiaceae bacterium]
MDEIAMRVAIECKRDGAELSGAQWAQIVEGFMEGRIDDAQLAALCMACVWRGMSVDEAFALTQAMVRSGKTLQFNDRRVVDKHSSGGVSDIVSLVAVPLAAACGAHVAKLSGRALGHTGGTIDKLETIPGFNVNLSNGAFTAQVERIGCAIAAQSAGLVPADKRIYNLRDRTGTVPAMGLIASSIVSKKVAAGAHAFVFDVKAGRASFMRKPSDAATLAQWLVDISARFGRRATAFVTDMNEPLGHSIGTGIEVVEAREFLRSEPRDERAKRLIVTLVTEMLASVGIADGEQRALDALANGAAYEKFVAMVEAQGGTRAALEAMQPSGDPTVVLAATAGYVHGIDVVRLGNMGRELASHDSLSGLRIAVRIGDRIEPGTPLAYIYGTHRTNVHALENAFELRPTPGEPTRLIYERLSIPPSS